MKSPEIRIRQLALSVTNIRYTHSKGQRKLDGQTRAATTVTNIAFDTRVIEFFRSVVILETDRSRGLINLSRYIYIFQSIFARTIVDLLHCIHIYIYIFLVITRIFLNSRLFRSCELKLWKQEAHATKVIRAKNFLLEKLDRATHPVSYYDIFQGAVGPISPPQILFHPPEVYFNFFHRFVSLS